MQALDHQQIAGSEAGSHDPTVAEGAVRAHRRAFHPVQGRLAFLPGVPGRGGGRRLFRLGRAQHQGVVAAGAVGNHRLLRREHGVFDHAFLHDRLDVHAGQEQALGVVERGPDDHAAGAPAYEGLGKKQVADNPAGRDGLMIGHKGVRRAVFQEQPHLGRTAVTGDFVLGDGTAQTHQVGAGLAEVHIDPVGLVDDRQHVRLPGRDQSAGRDRRTPDAAGNRGLDLGIGQPDGGGFQLGSGPGHPRPGLPVLGHGVVQFLTADRVAADKLPVARLQTLQGRDVGLGLFQGGLSGIEGRFIHGRVDLIEHLARAYPGPFFKQAGLDDAVHLRPDLGRDLGAHPAGQLGTQSEVFGREDLIGHFGRFGLLLLGLAAAREEQAEAEAERKQDRPQRGGFTVLRLFPSGDAHDCRLCWTSRPTPLLESGLLLMMISGTLKYGAGP